MFKSIGNALKGAVTGAAAWAGSAIGGAIGGPTGAKIGGTLFSRIGSSLMDKKAGGGDYQIQDTSVAAPNLSSFGNLSSYRPGEARGVDQRLTTVDADTLNQEWEYRLTKGFRNKNLFT
jgi:hypothetical protein|tara:strand:+ start:16 stop:372 length:357 start_codon:yes stop_codon:yes gene_type:complete